MGEKTAIQWCDHTWNPWRGCTKVSAGCTHCYAETLSKRNPKVLGIWGPEGTRVIASEAQWRLPLKWDRQARAAGVRRKVFCASLADVFEDRPELVSPRVRLFHLISETRNLDWLLLTKRPENIKRFHGGNGVPRSWPENMPPNVWLGVSVENQATADERIPLLLQTPAAVRFLSCEPLLGPVSLRFGKSEGLPTDREPCRERADLLHWVIIGGESGPHARPCYTDWIRSIVKQCQSAGVTCFVKQMGSVLMFNEAEVWAGMTDRRITDPKGGDPAEWPEDLRVREFPK